MTLLDALRDVLDRHPRSPVDLLSDPLRQLFRTHNPVAQVI